MYKQHYFEGMMNNKDNCKNKASQTPLEIAMMENERLRNRVEELESKYEMIVDLYLKTDRLFKEVAIELHNIEEASKAKLINGKA